MLALSEKEYAGSDGGTCPIPKCASRDIVGGDYNFKGHTVAQIVVCSDCGAKWIDFYKLVGYEFTVYDVVGRPQSSIIPDPEEN